MNLDDGSAMHRDVPAAIPCGFAPPVRFENDDLIIHKGGGRAQPIAAFGRSGADPHMFNAINFKAGLDYPPAWIVGAAAFGGIAWAGSLQTAPIIVGAAVGLAVTLLIGWLIGTAKHAEQRADELRDTRRREAEWRDMLQTMQAIVWQCDASLNRTFVNAAWTQRTGQQDRDALDAGWCDLVHTDDLSHYQASLRLATIEHEPGDAEYRLRTRDGDYVHVLERFVPLRDEDGAFTGLLAVAVDVTQRRRLEAELRQHIDDLQRVIESLNDRADDLVSRHEQLLVSRDAEHQHVQLIHEYLAALSTDLRTPLRDVHDAAGLLRASDLDEQQKTNVQRITDALRSLDAIAERSVELTALNEDLDAGIEIEQCDVRGLVERAADQLAGEAHDLNVRLACRIEGSVPALVNTDPMRLRRVLLMLWGAALQFVRKGTLTLEVSCDAKSGPTAHIVFSIMLPPRTIAQEVVDRAFYPEQPLDSNSGGLGLGRCQKLAEQLGGRIGIERDESGAASFWFKLNAPSVDAALDGRRSHNRLSLESVRSNLGLILDLSKGGMRVQSRRVPEDSIVDVEISDDEDTLLLRAEIAWSKKIGFRRNEIGIKFLELTPELEARLTQLATRNRVRRTFEAA